MAVAFQRGKTTGPSDLWIMIRDPGGNLVDPYRLEYAVYCVISGVEVLQGSPVNTAIRISLGHYYAQVILPGDCQIGLWRIRWTIQERTIDPVYQSVEEFQVIGDNSITSFTGDVNADKLVYSLRILLRDNAPDRNYRPPASEKFIQGQTQVFGFVWEDEELYEFLLMAVDDFNSRPPTTGIELYNLWGGERRWRTTIMVKAAAYALWALAINWIHDEFSYSISGVSLDIEKSSKYQGMADSFTAEFDKLVEQNKASIKIIKGLRQQKFGIGITSALGPMSRPGVQSRRNMLSAGYGGLS
jgi:hypothetical protein